MMKTYRVVINGVTFRHVNTSKTIDRLFTENYCRIWEHDIYRVLYDMKALPRNIGFEDCTNNCAVYITDVQDFLTEEHVHDLNLEFERTHAVKALDGETTRKIAAMLAHTLYEYAGGELVDEEEQRELTVLAEKLSNMTATKSDWIEAIEQITL